MYIRIYKDAMYIYIYEDAVRSQGLRKSKRKSCTGNCNPGMPAWVLRRGRGPNSTPTQQYHHYMLVYNSHAFHTSCHLRPPPAPPPPYLMVYWLSGFSSWLPGTTRMFVSSQEPTQIWREEHTNRIPRKANVHRQTQPQTAAHFGTEQTGPDPKKPLDFGRCRNILHFDSR